jgi:hypothetical protein
VGEDRVPGRIVFDSRMNTGLIEASALIDGDDNLLVEDERWVSGDKDTLKYKLRSVLEGTGCVVVYGPLVLSTGGMCLDGNQDPSQSDGVGPNGDDYIICYDCTYTDPNYAARYGSRWAYLDGDGAVVGWHVEAEIGTREYVVEGMRGGCWEELSRVNRGVTVAPDVYEARVPRGYDFYRVVEVDERGRRGKSRPLAASATEPALAARVKAVQVRLPQEVDGRRVHEEGPECEVGEAPGGTATGVEVPDLIMYGPDSLLAMCGPAVDWFEYQGEDVDTVHARSGYH